jgi:hypothetical protein
MAKQFLLGKDPIAVLHEIGQDTKHLWHKFNGPTGATEFIALDIEFPFFKRIEHKPPCPDKTAVL